MVIINDPVYLSPSAVIASCQEDIADILLVMPPIAYSTITSSFSADSKIPTGALSPATFNSVLK